MATQILALEKPEFRRKTLVVITQEPDFSLEPARYKISEPPRCFMETIS